MVWLSFSFSFIWFLYFVEYCCRDKEVQMFRWATAILLLLLLILSTAAYGQSPPQNSPEKIIIDTDIGDDVDDAFAVVLALRSP